MKHSNAFARSTLDLGPMMKKPPALIRSGREHLRNSVDGGLEQRHVERLAKHMWRVDSLQRSVDTVIVQCGNEDGGQIPPFGDEQPLQFSAPKVRKPDIEN